MRACRRFLDLVGVGLPIVQAPMIGPEPGLACAALAAGAATMRAAFSRTGT